MKKEKASWLSRVSNPQTTLRIWPLNEFTQVEYLRNNLALYRNPAPVA